MGGGMRLTEPCEAEFIVRLDGIDVSVARCQREAGHRPQVWHHAAHPKGGTVTWQFTNAEREEWKAKYGVATGGQHDH